MGHVGKLPELLSSSVGAALHQHLLLDHVARRSNAATMAKTEVPFVAGGEAAVAADKAHPFVN